MEIKREMITTTTTKLGMGSSNGAFNNTNSPLLVSTSSTFDHLCEFGDKSSLGFMELLGVNDYLLTANTTPTTSQTLSFFDHQYHSFPSLQTPLLVDHLASSNIITANDNIAVKNRHQTQSNIINNQPETPNTSSISSASSDDQQVNVKTQQDEEDDHDDEDHDQDEEHVNEKTKKL